MTSVTNGGEILISIPRTASTSLLAQMEQENRIIGSFAEKHGGLAYSLKYAEDLAADVQYTHEEAQFVRTFDPHELVPISVIRNPWDWLVSMYHSGVSVTPSRFDKERWPGSRIEPPDNPTIKHFGQRMGMTFGEFVEQRKSMQKDWLTYSDGSVGVTQENLRFFEDVIKATPRSGDRAGGPHYQEWYTIPGTSAPDKRLIDLVSRKCAWEIEVGGYTFE
jgi:hypothetical protein